MTICNTHLWVRAIATELGAAGFCRWVVAAIGAACFLGAVTAAALYAVGPILAAAVIWAEDYIIC